VSSLSGTSLEGSVEAIPHRIFVVYGGVLQRELQTDDVVIVHHAPSNFGAGKLYKSDPLSCCYYSNISDMLMDKQLKALFYGHMHKTANYMMGDLPIYSNPRGYANMAGFNDEFDPNLQFEL